jgi:hypothetical protein
MCPSDLKRLKIDPTPSAPAKPWPTGSPIINGAGSLRSRLTPTGGLPDPTPIVLSISYRDGLNISHRVGASLLLLKKAGSEERMLMVSLHPDSIMRQMLVEVGERIAQHGDSAATAFDLLIPIEEASGTSPSTLSRLPIIGGSEGYGFRDP